MTKSGAIFPVLAKRFFECLLPNTCLLCYHSNSEIICLTCRQRYLQVSPELRCQRCALTLGSLSTHSLCVNCIKETPAFDQTICAFDYAAPQDQLLLAFKFAQQLALGKAFADLLHRAILAHKPTILPELLSAVPLGPQRLAERGYNQAAEIARHLAPKLARRYIPDLVLREKDTLPQSRLNYQDRKKNVKAAFSLNLAYLTQISGKHIGLVDDVMTTGASLNEIATMLKLFGASQITVYVLARTPLSTHTH